MHRYTVNQQHQTHANDIKTPRVIGARAQTGAQEAVASIYQAITLTITIHRANWDVRACQRHTLCTGNVDLELICAGHKLAAEALGRLYLWTKPALIKNPRYEDWMTSVPSEKKAKGTQALHVHQYLSSSLRTRPVFIFAGHTSKNQTRC